MKRINVIKNLTAYLGFALEDSTLDKIKSLSEGNKNNLDKYLDNLKAYSGDENKIPKDVTGSTNRKLVQKTFQLYVKGMVDLEKYLCKQDVLR